MNRTEAMEGEDTVASLLRKYRVAAGISQLELAERANISVGAVGSLEQGLRSAPYPATLDALSNALQLDPEQRRRLREIAKRSRSRRPKPASGPAYRSNVPRPLTSFVQRPETAEIEALMMEHRLVTIVGSAGVGKTRTALAVLSRYAASDVFFVDLSPITDDDLVASEIASSLGIPTGDASTALGGLAARLTERRALIALDNCEHVVNGASQTVMAFLQACPHLRFLTTSREPLGLSSEIVFRLPSLANEAAVELFLARARSADARWLYTDDESAMVVDICRRVNGIPLAIELAAGRAPLLGLASLRDGIDLLPFENEARDVPARHQTMAAAIAWSFALLEEREHVLLRRLSVLSGAFTLACAHATCADEALPGAAVTRLLLQLARKSLIETRTTKPEYRYSLLDAVRTYAASELANADEVAVTLDRLVQWLLGIVRGAEGGAGIVGSMLAEIDNIRGAIEAKLRSTIPEDIANAGELVGSYRHLWMATNRQLELRRLCQAVLEKLNEAAYVEVAALVATAMAATTESRHRADLLERAIDLCTKAGDVASVAAHSARLAVNLINIGQLERGVERAMQAEQLLDRIHPLHRAQQYVRTHTVTAFIENGDVARARKTVADLDAIKAEQKGADDSGYVIWQIATRVEIFVAEGDYAAAAALCEETFAGRHGVVPAETLWLALWLSWIKNDLRLGNVERARLNSRRFIEESDTVVEFGHESLECDLVQSVASIMARRGDFLNAGRLLARADAMLEQLGYVRLRREREAADELRDLVDRDADPHALRRVRGDSADLTVKTTRALMAALLDGRTVSEVSE